MSLGEDKGSRPCFIGDTVCLGGGYESDNTAAGRWLPW